MVLHSLEFDLGAVSIKAQYCNSMLEKRCPAIRQSVNVELPIPVRLGTIVSLYRNGVDISDNRRYYIG